MSAMGRSRLWGKVTVLIVVCGWCLSAQAKYDGGSGDPNNPYQISSVADWQELMATPADWASHFVLTADIDLNDVSITPVAPDTNTRSGFQGTKFTGVFDGNGYVIRNADVNMPGSDYVGLFGYLRWRGQIKNLAIEDASIFGKSYVGGLVGLNVENSDIRNCYSTGSVRGTEGVGGLVAFNDATINNSYSSGPVQGTDWVGGLVGWNVDGPISNCYSTGSVSGNDKVGGLVGEHSGTMAYCYSTGSVGGSSRVGGLLGANYSGDIASSFWDIETSDCNTSAGGTPGTTAEMKTQTTFTDAAWDFIGETANGTEDIWAICEGTNYPTFVYQIPTGDIVCPDGVNSFDFALLARYWHETDCAALNDCEGADIDLSGAVDFGDFAAVAESWLTGL